MATDVCHIAIADDYAPIRKALQRFFEHEPGFQWAAQASDSEEAVALVMTHHVNVLVLDLSMPGTGGLQACPRLRAAAPQLRVLVGSAHPGSIFARKACELGASVYLENATDLDVLAATLKKVMEEVVPPLVDIPPRGLARS